MAEIDTDALTADECIEYDDVTDGLTCAGSVYLRESLSGTGTPIPRCEGHWADRLDREEELRRDYPDSPIPPAWFDPSACGEVWDDEY